MIRDAHDFRAGIHDRKLRKLTGRSYSALVHPVARDFPLDTMRPGDVFFHNDVYDSEGGIGHLPDLCVTLPVFVIVNVTVPLNTPPSFSTCSARRISSPDPTRPRWPFTSATFAPDFRDCSWPAPVSSCPLCSS